MSSFLNLAGQIIINASYRNEFKVLHVACYSNVTWKNSNSHRDKMELNVTRAPMKPFAQFHSKPFEL